MPTPLPAAGLLSPTFTTVPGSSSGLQAIIAAWKAAETTAQGGTLTTWWLWALRTIDYDKDGDQDVLIGIHANGKVGSVPGTQILQNRWVEDGTMRFVNVTASLVGGSRGLPASDASFETWDFDKDTWPDIAFFADESSPDQYRNNGSGTAFTVIASSTFNPINSPKISDLNADTYLDVQQKAEVYSTTPLLRVYEALYDKSTGRWAKTTTTLARPAGIPTTVGSAISAFLADYPKNRFLRVRYLEEFDLDGDGDNEIIVTGSGSYGGDNFCYFLENKGGGAFVDRTAAWGLPGNGNVSTVVDLDGDSELDIVIARSTANSGVYIHQAGGGYTQVADSSLVAFLQVVDPYPTGVVAEDFNGDGLKDLVLKHPRLKNYRVYGQPSAGVFQLLINGDGKGWDADGTWLSDLDGDGQTDIIAGGAGDDITIYMNTSVAVPPK